LDAFEGSVQFELTSRPCGAAQQLFFVLIEHCVNEFVAMLGGFFQKYCEAVLFDYGSRKHMPISLNERICIIQTHNKVVVILSLTRLVKSDTVRGTVRQLDFHSLPDCFIVFSASKRHLVAEVAVALVRWHSMFRLLNFTPDGQMSVLHINCE